MSINDPQWGNSHRPDDKHPEQAPESSGADQVQPENTGQNVGQNAGPAAPTGLNLPELPSSSAPTQSANSTHSTGSSQTPRPPGPPEEGPPDLEVLWQQLRYNVQSSIARLLGRPLPNPPSRQTSSGAVDVKSLPVPASGASEPAPIGWQSLSLKSWLIGVSLLVCAWLISGFYLVDVQQRGVLNQLGRIASVQDPGWHWRWPYPIDSVRLINVEADRTLEVGLSETKNPRQSPGLMRTADGNLVAMGYAVVYQVTDPVAYVSRASAPADLLAPMAEDGLRDLASGQTLASLQTLPVKTPGQENPAMVGVRERLQKGVDDLGIGVQIKRLEVRDVQLPAPVLQSIKALAREEQAQVKALREAQSQSTDSLIKARKLAAQIETESAAYLQAIDQAAQAVRVAPTSVPPAEGEKAFGQLLTSLRQQYPLVFASATSLRERVVPASKKTQGAVDKTPSGSDAPASTQSQSATGGEWRDREIMRSRDRVDRPGVGL